MNTELDANEFQSSLSTWTQVLKTAAPDEEPHRHLVDDWLRFVPKTEAEAIAASGISPALVAEAKANGFQPDDQEPGTLAILRARAMGYLTRPVERSTARQLSIALIDFTRKEHCALVQPAIDVSDHTHLSLADAVFLLKKSHEEQQIVAVLDRRPEATASEVHELIRFGSATQDWESLSIPSTTRRLLQRAGITPDQYQAWAKLGVTEQDEILDASQMWAPAEAEKWMASLNMPHREAAAWFSRGHDLRLARAWISLGYDAAQAVQLKARDVGPAEAKVWAGLGVCGVEAVTAHKAAWTPDDLAQWDGWDAAEALMWSRKFEHPELAEPWQRVGIPADLAAELAARQWSPGQAESHSPEVLRAALSFAGAEDSIERAFARLELWESLATRDAWAAALGGNAEPDQLDDWYRSGLAVESVVFLKEKGLTPQDAGLFKELDMTSVREQEEVLSHFGSPHTLVAWLNAGFTQEAATRWNASGYSVEIAAEWVAVNATIDLANELSAQGASPNDWGGYSDLGIELGTALAMAQKGLNPEKFLVWRNQLPGLGALDVLAWFGTGGSLEEVISWQAQGLTPVQASASHASPEP